MTKGYLIKIVISFAMMLAAVTAQENVDAIEKARQAKEAADKAAAEAAAATSAAIEAAAAKAAKEAREEAKRKKEEEEARKIAEAKAAEEAELDAAAAAAAEEAKRKMAAELGLEIDDPEVEEAVAEASISENTEETEEVIAKEASGWGLGLTGSVGLINGEYILNTPVGGSLTITTPYGLKLGALNLEVSLAAGSYSGETPNSPDYSPTFFGVGGNLTLADFLFYEGHVGIVGAGPGGRGFGGITLERLLKRSMNLPFNLLIGAEGFLSTKLEDGRDEASYWGGLGARLDIDF